MNLEQYERRVRIHQVYAESLTSHLVRLWARPLTAPEQAIVDSSTICCTFMRLELLEARLASARSASTADEVFGYMDADVAQGRSAVIRAMTAFAVDADMSVDDFESTNLLTFELEILKRHKQLASGA